MMLWPSQPLLTHNNFSMESQVITTVRLTKSGYLLAM